MNELNFFAAMRAAPDDDDLRLVYADWLEEQGEAFNAEYVRVAVGFSKIKDEHDEQRSAFFDREQELDRLHGDIWRQRLAGYLPEEVQRRWCWSGLWFSRGVPGSLDAEVSKFALDADLLMNVFPITGVRLRAKDPAEVELLGSLEAFRHVEWMSLWAPPELGAVTLQALGDSPHLARLRSLQLFGLSIGDAGLAALVEACERFPRLDYLELTSTGITGEGVKALAGSPLMKRLKTLWLRENAIGPEGLRALARAEAPVLEQLWLPDTDLGDVGKVLATARWPALWRLDLDNSGLAPSSLSALLRAEWFTRIRDLSVRGLTFTRRRNSAEPSPPRPTAIRCLSLGSPALDDAGLLRLLQPYQFPELRSLWVSDSRIGDEAIAALTAHRCDHLSALYLMDNEIGTEGAWRLITSPNLPAVRSITLSRNRIGAQLFDLSAQTNEPRLQSLDLSRNPMTTEAARALLSRPELSRLRELKLSHCYLGPEGGGILARGPITTTLQNLLLCGTALEDEGVVELLKAAFLPSVRDLSLQGIGLTEKGLLLLVESENLRDLLSLRLDRNQLGPEAGALLASAPWLARLTCLHLSDSSLGDEGVTALAASPNVGKLGFLGLNAVELTEVGVRTLLDSPHLSARVHVHLAGNAEDIQERFGSALSARFGEVEFTRKPHIDNAW